MFIRFVLACGLAAMICVAALPAASAQKPASARPAAGGLPAAVPVSYRDAAPILAALRPDLLPPDLRIGAPAERANRWAAWVSGRHAAVRERLIRGDEDSIVNLFWFGTSFTTQPRLTPERLAALDRGASDAAYRARLDDLTAGILEPGANERLQFARSVARARSVDLGAPGDRDRVRRYLEQLVARSLAELAAYQQAPGGSQSTLYRGRGLSSDTSLLVDFALEQTLAAVAARDLLRPGGVRRVAIVGPGLDITDKEGGYDFYPLQTIQPFAVVDSLMRVGLASASLSVTTFDVNERVNQHVGAAIARAQKGGSYALHLPLDAGKTWDSRLTAFWDRFGDRIGTSVAAVPLPEGAGRVKVRSIAVRPDVVRVIRPSTLNIVLQRQALASGARFDLVIATNILLYYDVFEQSLAIANIAAMLRPGGLLLSSDFVYPLPAVPMTIAGDTRVRYDGGAAEDVILWYQRD